MWHRRMHEAPLEIPKVAMSHQATVGNEPGHATITTRKHEIAHTDMPDRVYESGLHIYQNTREGTW